MKKIVFTLLTAALLFSCGGGSNSGSGSSSDGDALVGKNVDYKMFTNEAEVKRVMDGIYAKAGDNISKLDEMTISLNRPSKSGTIKRDDPDYVHITLTYLNPKNPKKLFQYNYSSNQEKWDNGESMDVNLITGNAETFVLADEMYDASGLTSDMAAKMVMEAWNKYKDEAKYSEQWVANISIKEGKIRVTVRGLLASNDLEKYEIYEKKLP
jgi:hypothetical protein